MFWHHRYYSELTNARRRLLGQIIRQPNYVRLAAPESTDANVEIPIEDLKPSDVILISAGEQIPVDGRVLEGRVWSMSDWFEVSDGLNRKRPDDAVLAGSTLRFGELHVEVLRQGSQTQAAALARATLAVDHAYPLARELRHCEERSLPNERLCRRWPLPVWDSWWEVSELLVPSCDLTMRPVWDWRFRSRRSKPSLFA